MWRPAASAHRLYPVPRTKTPPPVDDWQYRPARDLGLTPSARRASLDREPGPMAATSGWAWRLGVRLYLRSIHRLRVRGREHLPLSPPYVLVANHASHLDALVLAAAVPPRVGGRLFPLAAGDTFFATPAVSAFAAGVLNALPMWRDRTGAHALDTLRDRLAQDGCVYVLFPEGTRSRTGAMGAFKPGLGHLVAGTDVPVVPCWLEGTHRAFPPERRLPRPARVGLTVGPPLTFAGVPDTRDGWREVARQAEAAVRALSLPAGPGPETRPARG